MIRNVNSKNKKVFALKSKGKVRCFWGIIQCIALFGINSSIKFDEKGNFHIDHGTDFYLLKWNGCVDH